MYKEEIEQMYIVEYTMDKRLKKLEVDAPDIESAKRRVLNRLQTYFKDSQITITNVMEKKLYYKLKNIKYGNWCRESNKDNKIHSLFLEDMAITIYNPKDKKKDFYLTCRVFGIEDRKLKANILKDAETEACKIIRNAIYHKCKCYEAIFDVLKEHESIAS